MGIPPRFSMSALSKAHFGPAAIFVNELLALEPNNFGFVS
jgi:hypothetical protein